MGNTCCSVPSVEEAESAQKFRQADTNNNNLVDRSEMGVFIKGHPEMWAMISVNLGLNEDVCQTTATRVAMELASGKEGAAAMISELTEAQFHAFRSKYMVNGKGSQEFFHRCVFASFAKDGKHYLDTDSDLEAFLNTFYKAGSIFEGDTRLPPKQELKERITQNNPTGKITFEEIRDVIRGTTSIPKNSGVSTTRHSTMSESNPAAESQSAPEETPEPARNLPPPSMEFRVTEWPAPEETPEEHIPPPDSVSPPTHKKEKPKKQREDTAQDSRQESEEEALSPPSPKQKSRQRKPKSDRDRAASRSRSPSTRRKSRAASRSRSPNNQRPRKNTRSGSPTQRRRRAASRSSSPSQRKPRAPKKDKEQSQEEPQEPLSSAATKNKNSKSPKRRNNNKQAQKPKETPQ